MQFFFPLSYRQKIRSFRLGHFNTIHFPFECEQLENWMRKSCEKTSRKLNLNATFECGMLYAVESLLMVSTLHSRQQLKSIRNQFVRRDENGKWNDGEKKNRLPGKKDENTNVRMRDKCGIKVDTMTFITYRLSSGPHSLAVASTLSPCYFCRNRFCRTEEWNDTCGSNA